MAFLFKKSSEYFEEEEDWYMKKLKKAFAYLDSEDIALAIIGGLIGVVIGTAIFYLFIK